MRRGKAEMLCSKGTSCRQAGRRPGSLGVRVERAGLGDGGEGQAARRQADRQAGWIQREWLAEVLGSQACPAATAALPALASECFIKSRSCATLVPMSVRARACISTCE